MGTIPEILRFETGEHHKKIQGLGLIHFILAACVQSRAFQWC